MIPIRSIYDQLAQALFGSDNTHITGSTPQASTQHLLPRNLGSLNLPLSSVIASEELRRKIMGDEEGMSFYGGREIRAGYEKAFNLIRIYSNGSRDVVNIILSASKDEVREIVGYPPVTERVLDKLINAGLLNSDVKAQEKVIAVTPKRGSSSSNSSVGLNTNNFRFPNGLVDDSARNSYSINLNFASLQKRASNFGLTIAKSDAVSNMLKLPWGELARCRHLATMWMKDEGSIKDAPTVLDSLSKEKLQKIQDDYIASVIKTKDMFRLVSNQKLGECLAELLDRFPAVEVEMPLFVPHHTMAIKISCRVDKKFTIKIYDPEIAKVIEISGSSAESIKSLRGTDLIPNLKAYFSSNNPVGVTIGWPDEVYCSSEKNYITLENPTSDFEFLFHTFHTNQLKEAAWLLNSIRTEYPKEAVKKALLSPALNTEFYTLGSIPDEYTPVESQRKTLTKIFDLMNWAELKAEDIANHINRKGVSRDPLPYVLFAMKSLISDFLDGCQNSGIKGKLFLESLGSQNDLGQTAIMACLALDDSNNLNELLKRLSDFDVNLDDFIDLLGKGRFNDNLTATHFMLNFGFTKTADLLFKGLRQLGASKEQLINLLVRLDSNGLTPIWYALDREQKETINNLFRNLHSFNFAAEDAFKLITTDNILFKICKAGNTAMLDVLLNALSPFKIDNQLLLELKDKDGNTMIDIAMREGHQNLVKLLVDLKVSNYS